MPCPNKIFGQGISSFIGPAASRRCQLVSRSRWPRNIPKPMLESAASRTTYHFGNDRKNMPAATTRRCLFTLVRSTRTHLINRERVRCWRIGAAARREEGEYPLWIFDRRATPLQRQRCATLRAKLWRAAGGVAAQSQNASAMLLRRAVPAAPPELSA